MATPLKSFRQQYPQYEKYSDTQLADALYDKFYAGKIEKPEYLKQLGLAEPPATSGPATIAKPPQNIADLMGLEREEPEMSKAGDAAAIYRNLRAAEAGTEPTLKPPTPTPASFESVAKGLGTAFRTSIPQTAAGIKAAGGQYAAKLAERFGEPEAAEMLRFGAEQAQRRGEQLAFEQDLARPAIEDPTLRGIYGGAESLARNIPSMALGLAAVPAGASVLGATALATLAGGTQVAAEAFNKYMGRGASLEEASLGALGEGGVEIITEAMPMGFLIGKFGKSGAKEFIAGLLMREIPGEQVATLAQDAIDTAIANPDKTWAEYWAERPAAAYQTLIATITQAGLTTAGSKATQYVSQKLSGATPEEPLVAPPVEVTATPEEVNAALAAAKPERVEPSIGAEPTIAPTREEPTFPTAPTEAVAPPPPATDATTIEELLETEGPTRPSVLAPEQVDYGQLNRELLAEGAITEEQLAQAEEDEINRRLREASMEEDQEFFDEGELEEGVAEPKLTQRGKKMVTPLESAKMDLTNATRAANDYEARIRGVLEATGQTIDQLPDTTQQVLAGLKQKQQQAQTAYDALLDQERQTAAVIEPGLTLEQLKAEQNALRTKAGKPPAPKSVARSRFDALQQQITALEKPAEEAPKEAAPPIPTEDSVVENLKAAKEELSPAGKPPAPKSPARAKFDEVDALLQQIEDLRAQGQNISAMPGADIVRLTKLLGPKLYGSLSELPIVSAKELLQNSFDAIKARLELGDLAEGRIRIALNPKDRTIEVLDNGTGMRPEILATKFLEIAGTKKETKDASGGLGIAKMQFLFGNKSIEVITVRDNTVSILKTTGPELEAALSDPAARPDISVTPFDEAVAANPNIADMFPDRKGTFVKIEIPEKYTNPDTGKQEDIDVPSSHYELTPVIKSPLFRNIDVSVASLVTGQTLARPLGVDDWQYSTIPIGKNFPTNEFVPLTKITFGWGDATLYSGTTEEKYNFSQGRVYVLSNGVYQFKDKIQGPKVQFYLDLRPRVAPEEPGYPFDLNRQRFSPVVDEDIKKIYKYVEQLYALQDLQGDVNNFGSIQYLGPQGPTAPKTLAPPVPPMDVPTNLLKPGDTMAVVNGELLINGVPVPEITADEVSKFKIDVTTLTIPQDEIDSNVPILHNNVLYIVKDANGNELDTIGFADLIANQFGDRFYTYMRDLGNVFMELRDVVAAELGYGGAPQGGAKVALDREAIGISFDTEYRGVNTRIPFSGMYLNPAAVEFRVNKNAKRTAVGMIGTMVHELAHHQVRSHNAAFPAEMQRILAALDTAEVTGFDFADLKNRVIALVEANKDIQAFMEERFYEQDNIKPVGNRLQDSSSEQTGDGRTTTDLGEAGEGAASYQRIPSGPQQGQGPAQPQQVGARTTGKAPKGRPAKAPKVYQNLDRTLNRFKNTPQGAIKAVTNLISIMANRPNVVFWSKAMPLLPDWAVRSLLPRQLVKNGDKFELKSILPQLDTYDKALAAFERTQKELEGEIVKIVQMGLSLPTKTHEALSVLQLEATSREIDPDVNTKDPYLNQLWTNLQNMKDGAKAIEVYRKQRDFYKAVYNKIRANAAKNLYKALVRKLQDPAEAARRTKEILDRDMPQRKDPYFPMARFGEFWIGFKMMNDEGKLEKGFLMFESGLARDKALRDIESAIREEIKQANPGMTDKDVDDVMVNEERLQARDGFSNLLNFVYGQENALSKARDVIGESIEEMIAGLQKSGTATITTAQAEKLLRSAKEDATGTIQQLLIQLAPMGSLKRLFAKRKNIAGAVADSNRSFAVTATKQMNYLAKIMHGGQMEASLIAANEGLKYLSPRNQIFAGQVISEFELRMESNLSPQPQSAAIQLLSGSAFVMQMTTVASAIRNMMYMFWNGFSVIGSRLGLARTSAMMSKYLVGFGRGFYAKDRPDGVFGVGFPSLLYNKKLNKFVRYGLERAVAENKLNISQAYDLAEIRRTPSGIPLLSMRGIFDSPRRIVNMLAVVLHNSERIGREALWATALEGRARQLFAEKKPDGTRRYTDDEISQLAYEFADEYAGERGAGTFGYQRRGRIFKTGLPNLILKYKSAPIQVIFQMFEAHNKLAWHRFRRFIREEKKRIEADPQLGPNAVAEFERLIKQESYSAAKYLVFLTAISFAFMGLEGTPYWWLLSKIAGYFLRRNDPNVDNPEAVGFDLDTFLENYTQEQMGAPWAQMLMRGPAATATNVSLVDQMSLNPPSMFLQGWSDTADKSGEAALQKAMIFALGPVFGGLPVTAARAYDAGKRDTMRGVEMMLPGGLRTPIASARVAREGYTTTKGEVRIPKEQVTAYDLFLTGFGFSPEDYRRQQEMIFKAETTIAKQNLRRSELMDDYFLTSQMPEGPEKKEVMDALFKRVENFNAAFPSNPITGENLMDSLERRSKMQAETQGREGVSASEKTWPIVQDQTEFGKLRRLDVNVKFPGE